MAETFGVRQPLADPTGVAGGFWQRVRAWFETAPAERPGALEEHREVTTPIAVAAQGDAFDFMIHPTITWRSEGLTEEGLAWWIGRCTPVALRKLRRQAAGLARTHPPHLAHRLEEELNRELAQQSWRFRPDEVDLICRVRVQVRPDERVRASLQPIWQRRIEMESEHELGMRHAELVRERTQLWSSIMEKLQDNPLTSHAAALTEEQFAKVFQAMIESRKETATTLVKLLQEAIRGHNSVGLYEYAESFDAALKAFQKHVGWTGIESYEPDTSDSP